MAALALALQTSIRALFRAGTPGRPNCPERPSHKRTTGRSCRRRVIARLWTEPGELVVAPHDIEEILSPATLPRP